MSDRTFEVIEKQVSAMGADVFEIGLFKPGAMPEMIPRTWDRATLLRSVGWLKHQNSQGRNIYIRPKGEHSLSLIDDLTRESVDRMKREGFEPCVVVETSPANFQAWVNHGRVLERAESTAAARGLAERFGGDKGAADWRHFGRLAGLTNRKPKYQGADGRFPFVRLVEVAPGRVYESSRTFLSHLQACRTTVLTVVREPLRPAGQLLTIDAFRVRDRYSGDGHRVDLAYAIYSLSHGVSEPDLRHALSSRDLSKKGTERRVEDYIERTVKKAIALVRATNTMTR